MHCIALRDIAGIDQGVASGIAPFGRPLSNVKVLFCRWPPHATSSRIISPREGHEHVLACFRGKLQLGNQAIESFRRSRRTTPTACLASMRAPCSPARYLTTSRWPVQAAYVVKRHMCFCAYWKISVSVYGQCMVAALLCRV